MLTDSPVVLRFDPYGVFTDSATPVGLYARQKWLGQEKEGDWRAAFDGTVASLQEGRLNDGSWEGSFIQTVRRLFGLHLTVRNPTDAIDRALDWLLSGVTEIRGHEDEGIADMEGLPFVAGNRGLLCTGMALFLAVVFGREDRPEILGLYRNLSGLVFRSQNLWDNPGDINNILRAMVVHPLYARDRATISIVENLSGRQDDSGQWPDPLPFYQTVNALAHLDLPQSDKLLKKAFALLARTQNEDGTWGDIEKEWNTFLVVHAMRKKKILR